VEVPTDPWPASGPAMNDHRRLSASKLSDRILLATRGDPFGSLMGAGHSREPTPLVASEDAATVPCATGLTTA